MTSGSAQRFGSLVGAQLNALIEAEVEAARRASEFIEAVGFERADDGTSALAMVSFDMLRRDVDGVERTHTIRIPVLTLIQIPLLTIESAQINFAARVEGVASEGEQPAPDRPVLMLSDRLATGEHRTTLITRLARTAVNDTETKADLRVTVNLAQSPFPAGIELLLQAAELGVQDVAHDEGDRPS
jgi:hypothetical protein